MLPEAKTLIFELDAAVSVASNSWHSELLRRVTEASPSKNEQPLTFVPRAPSRFLKQSHAADAAVH